MNLDDIITPEQDPAGNLSEMAANLRFEDIPPEDVDFVKRDILESRRPSGLRKTR